MTEPILFSGGIPSNFYTAPIVIRCPITGRPRRFRSNEYYFHVSKLIVSPVTQEEKEAVAKLIIAAAASREAKRIGKLRVYFDDYSRVAWDTQFAPIAMLTCNLAKFRQNQHCRDWLIATGTHALVEHRPDPIWGDNMDGTGMNLLGKTIMI